MKPSEFLEIKEKFEKEQLYWEALKPGQIVFEEFGRFFDMEYYKHEIVSINIEERVLNTSVILSNSTFFILTISSDTFI